jgi:hypothetical protein
MLLTKTIIMKLLSYFSAVCIFALVTTFTSCSKNKSDNKSLTGTWKWVRTDGGIAFHIHETPANTGKNIDLQFTDDNHYTIYTNGAITSQGTYSLETQNCIHDHSDKKVINFSSPLLSDMMIERIDNLSLDLSDNAYDGCGSSYTRQ